MPESAPTKPAKLIDVARAAGVSHGTASNVFNRPEIVSEDVRFRVRAAADAIGYAGPDVKGRLLRAGKVNAIGVASAQPLSIFFEDPFARELMASIAETCDARGAGLSLVSAINNERLAWNIESAIVDGFILFCVESGPRLVELTRARKLPFVTLELGLEDKTISAIGVDDLSGGRLAAAHMAELGHRRFAIIALRFTDEDPLFVSRAEIEAATYFVSQDRANGYFEVLVRHGVDTGAVPILAADNDKAKVRAGLEQIFAGPNPPTALLAMSDRMALFALDWLAGKGLSVPGDVSVIGFDDVPEAARSSPPLSTIAQPIKLMGQLAVEAILDHGDQIRRQEVQAKLVVRGSTAPPKQNGA